MAARQFYRVVLLGFLALPLMGASRQEKTEIADKMIDAFSQGCGTGPWTQAALSRASQITAIYQSLLDKQGCVGNPNVQRALGAAQGLESELIALQGASALSQERTWEEASNDLLVQINLTADAEIRSNLIAQYGTARYNLSEKRSEANYLLNPGYKERMVYGFQALNSRFRDLLSASGSLADCYNKNPGMAMHLGASLAELGGAFAPPMIGLGVSAVSNLLKVGVQFAVMAPTIRAVRRSRAVKMPMALSCGLEALTRDYCKARDARSLLEFSLKKNDGKTLPFFFGTDLQDRYMPALYGWLDQVVNGSSKIRSSTHADIINAQFRRLSNAQINLRYSEGFFSELGIKVKANPTVEVDYVKAVIRALVSIFYSVASSSGGLPTADSSSLFSGFESAAGFVGAIAPHGAPPGSFSTLDQLLDALKINAGEFNVVQRKFSELFKKRFDLAMADFNEKVQISPSSTVRDATRRKLENGLSPILAWQRMYQFLDQYAYDDGAAGIADRRIIADFRRKLDPVYSQLLDPESVGETCVTPMEDPENPVTPPPLCIAPATRVLTRTHDAFKLDNNNVYLPKIVSDLVKTDLSIRACRGETPKEISDLIRIGGTDLTLLMQRAGISSPAAVKSDLSTAQTITMGSLEQFRDYYIKTISSVMGDLRQMADRNKEPRPGSENAPIRDQLSKLCILTYISGMGDDEDIDYDAYCGDAKIKSAGEVTISFSGLRRSLTGKPMDQRICSYENFLRVDRLKNQNISPSLCLNESLAEPASSRHDSASPAHGEFWQSLLYSK